MTRITEYVGHLGVRSSPYDHRRAMHPKPGDFIAWPNGKVGRVEYIYDAKHPRAFVDRPGDLLCCVQQGSAFLGWNGETEQPFVSISGGPFITINTDELTSHGLCTGTFWNWGDNHVLPGADMGVEYDLTRPCFRYTGESTHHSIRKEDS